MTFIDIRNGYYKKVGWFETRFKVKSSLASLTRYYSTMILARDWKQGAKNRTSEILSWIQCSRLCLLTIVNLRKVLKCFGLVNIRKNKPSFKLLFWHSGSNSFQSTTFLLIISNIKILLIITIYIMVTFKSHLKMFVTLGLLSLNWYLSSSARRGEALGQVPPLPYIKQGKVFIYMHICIYIQNCTYCSVYMDILCA